jgi:hypothetical protein
MKGADYSNEDDLTGGLAKIIESNNQLKVAMDKGQGIDCFKVSFTFSGRKLCAHPQTNWEALSFTVALYINSQTPGIKLPDVSGNAARCKYLLTPGETDEGSCPTTKG